MYPAQILNYAVYLMIYVVLIEIERLEAVFCLPFALFPAAQASNQCLSRRKRRREERRERGSFPLLLPSEHTLYKQVRRHGRRKLRREKQSLYSAIHSSVFFLLFFLLDSSFSLGGVPVPCAEKEETCSRVSLLQDLMDKKEECKGTHLIV